MLESHNLLDAHQFGFCKKLSTTTLLMTAINDGASSLDHNQSAQCLFLNMSKAFHSVPHKRLLLNYNCMEWMVLNWLGLIVF